MKKVFSNLLLLFLILFLYIGCSKNSDISNSQEKDHLHHSDDESTLLRINNSTEKLIDLKTVKVDSHIVYLSISTTGRITPNANNVAIIAPIISGRVSEIYVNQGDYIYKDQKLVEIESVELGEAISNFYVAKTEYELAKVNYERAKALWDKKIGSQKDLFAAEAELKNSMSNFFAAEQQLHIMGLSEEEVQKMPEITHEINPRINLVSPINGTIIERDVILGDKVDPESNLFRIVNLSTLWVDADIYENDINKISNGHKVEITLNSYPGIKFYGKIMYVGSEFNDETRTIPVRTEVLNQDSKLKIGMFANVKIFINDGEKSLAVPEAAVLDEKGKKVVFLKENDGYTKHFVIVGNTYKGYIEIKEGLNAGDEIVTSGNFQLLSESLSGRNSGVHTH